MATIKELLYTAMEPIGKTMYIWGGGWNSQDTGAGEGAKHIGVPEIWKVFERCQNETYDFHNYLYRNELGLDCSGYVGWCMYNLFPSLRNQEFVFPSTEIAKHYSDRGFGEFRLQSEIVDYKPGDIMSGAGHVWMGVGACEDGSVVIIHASPPGVQLNGTVTPDGNRKSRAIELARYYMKTYYPEWYARFPNVEKDKSYLTSYHQMRWYVGEKKGILRDPDGYMEMPVKDILRDLWIELRKDV